jgi:5-formyltetrahydrofolate cyclo-ligase
MLNQKPERPLHAEGRDLPLQRNADSEFHGTFRAPTYFDDLTERCAVKLTSLLRITGPPHYSLWSDQVGGQHFRERTGQFIPIYSLDLFVNDEFVETREAFDVEVTIRLGKETAPDGAVARLVSEGQTQVFAHRSGGGRICVGGTTKHCVFTRPDADPAQRRVTELHPYMNLGKLPEREMRLLGIDSVTAPPRNYRLADGGGFEDREPHVWSYLQTDPNRHVHAMEYVRALERFAVDHLARLGRSPRRYFFDRARVVFRRPAFTGDLYVRRGSFHLSPDGERDLFLGSIHAVGPEDLPTAERPINAAVQLFVRNRPAGAEENAA